MAKGKGKNVHGHIRARLDYLHKAAAYLQSRTLSSRQRTQQHNNEDRAASDGKSTRTVPHLLSPSAAAPEKVDEKQEATTDHLPNLSRAYISNLRGVSLKTQLRLPREVKRSFCKRCDTLLVPGVNCTEEIKNASRDGRKPWADVRVVRCTTCFTEKRYPQTERRGRKLAERRKERENQEGQAAGPWVFSPLVGNYSESQQYLTATYHRVI